MPPPSPPAFLLGSIPFGVIACLSCLAAASLFPSFPASPARSWWCGFAAAAWHGEHDERDAGAVRGGAGALRGLQEVQGNGGPARGGRHHRGAPFGSQVRPLPLPAACGAQNGTPGAKRTPEITKASLLASIVRI